MRKSDASHADLTQHCFKSLVATSTVLHGIELSWENPRRRIEATFQVTIPDTSSPNGALCAVKATPEGDESHADLTRDCGESLVATSAVLHVVYLTWKYPRRRIEATFQVTGPDFSSPNGALCAVKATPDSDESHADLTLHCGKSLVAISAVLHCVYLTWKYIEATFQVTIPDFSSPNGALCAVKATSESDKSHAYLI